MNAKLGLGLAVLLLASACGEDQGGGDTTPEPTPAVTPTAAPAVTWHRDIKPLIDQSCLRCHQDNGVAPSDFSDFEVVAPRADVLASYVDQGLMPPPVADPECRDYDNSDILHLNDEKRALFREWADLGAPEGQVEDAPEARVADAQIDLSEFDVSLRIPEYSPVFDATGNDYTCFVLDPQLDQDMFITAMAPIVDELEISHHLLLNRGNRDEVMAAFDSGVFKCGDAAKDKDANLSEMMSKWEALTAWAPGGPVIEFDEGMGMPLKKDDVLILQMHYFESSPGATLLVDTSGYALKLTESVDRRIYQFYIGPTDFKIPAGDESYSASMEFKWLASYGPGYELLGVFPHMHVLGESWRFHVEKARGAGVDCVSEGRYEFNNQLNYMFKESALLEAGDSVFAECTWNNSPSNPKLIYDPPIEVGYGEGTGSEMCFMITYAAELPE